MRTALVLTNSADTQRLLTEIAGSEMHFIATALPAEETTAANLGALLTKWLRLVEAVIVDAASLGEGARLALETLMSAALPEHPAVVVRIAVGQTGLPSLPPQWLVVSAECTPEQLEQSLRTLFQMHDARAQLKRADALFGGQRAQTQGVGVAAAPLAASPFDSFRYREALKSISRIVGQRHEERELLVEYLRLVGELLGVARLAILLRPFETELFHEQPTPSGNVMTVAASQGVASEVVEHLRLTLTGGIGAYAATEAKILRRGQRGAATVAALEAEGQVAREFEWLGTEVVVPILDNGQLFGLLTFSGKVTSEALSNEELELVYHLMTQLAQALRNLHLVDQVANQQQFIGEVLANVQSGVVVMGQGGRVLCVNNRARQLLELGTQDIVGHRTSRLPSRVADVLFEVLETGREVGQREVMLPLTNRPLAVSAKRFAPSAHDANGRGNEQGNGFVDGSVNASAGQIVVGMIEDLTQVKQRESQQRVLAERELFSRVAARLSHELRNALVSIKIFSQLLPERYNEAEFRTQFSKLVIDEVDRVDSLMSKLTFFAHPLRLVREEVELGELIGAALMDVSLECARRRTATLVYGAAKTVPATNDLPVVTVKTSFTHKATQLEADRIRLLQCFGEVLHNAAQSMPKGGRLLISTRDAIAADFPNGQLPEGGAVRIDWQDTGEGIPLDNLKRIVEPFVTSRNVGVGLGLTIVKKIVERHGGWLEIDSMFGKGTVVAMMLPVKAQRQCGETELDSETSDDASEKQVDVGETSGPDEVLSPKLGTDFQSQ
jgi:nitrogen-specific signal transduction histidine kinase